MSQQKHIIKRQLLELTIQGRGDTHWFQTEMSRLCRQQLVPLLDKSCSELSRSNYVHRIDRLQVDLGQIDAQNFAADFSAKMAFAFRRALAKEIGHMEQDARGQGETVYLQSQLELFTLFATGGILPWWADPTQPGLLHNCLRDLIQNEPDQLRKVLLSFSHEQQSLQRIVNYYPDQLLGELVALLLPWLQSQQAQHPQQLVSLLQAIPAATAPEQMRRRGWLTMLKVAGQWADLGQASLTQQPLFYQLVLHGIATGLETSYPLLLLAIHRLLETGAPSVRPELHKTLEALYQQSAATTQQPTLLARLLAALNSLVVRLALQRQLAKERLLVELQALENKVTQQRAVTAQDLRRLFEILQAELIEANKRLAAFVSNPLLTSATASLPTIVDSLSRHRALDSPARHNLLDALRRSPFLDAATRRSLLDLLSLHESINAVAPDGLLSLLPSGDRSQALPPSRLAEVIQALERIPAQTAAERANAEMQGKANEQTDAQTGEQVREQTREQIREQTREQTREQIREEARKRAREEAREVDLSFSTADELYINNAGLVILWPFLEHFLSHLQLLENKAFKHEVAQQRAVGLLQLLAGQDDSLAEYLLPLNKILCGMAVTGLFDFGPPVTEDELEACHDFLTAIIAQAPILRDMPVDGLRGTFLLRSAVLSRRDGMWLLRVERQTYDIVLDHFPWGWQWVKLPWMNAPLRVEW